MDAWINAAQAASITPLVATDEKNFEALMARLGKGVAKLCNANDFHGENGRFLGIPGTDGEPSIMLVGCNASSGLFALASLPRRLPAADYALDSRGIALDPADAALGWALGAYHFSRYRKPTRQAARLVIDDALRARVTSLAEAATVVRDLINTPTQDMGPADLAGAVRALAERHAGDYREWIGDELLRDNFPTIHAVGRAATASRAPRLAMLSHGAQDAPHVVLVGKGVCFDTGGLDLKNADGMRWMKKDMGGAAHAIGLAGLILDSKLPIRLTLLIPAVENSVSGDSFRPGDVIQTRGNLSVEIDNTDAEGRLVLCDALAYAGEMKPDLILDFATLTGAARVALGADLPALFCNRDEIATALLDAGTQTQDPLWRMPLWRPYLTMLDSYIADLANSGPSRQGGAISAALFLERFVPEQTPWCHLDVYSWNDSERPGRPKGGEAQGLRAYLAFLKQRFGGAGVGSGE
ncbi:MAG TPA: leucyl aminopeptidase family protein [Dokdonella sp.]|uniref:leucyl aminopeptidase family protein n=1 Tax=Dokdonella sp. TaxID=2291710 RepID=UPI002D7E2006|nr:leucyl aminopeptidase family protein [Dokdonella sp.]HET9033005.1 leucyl aminopeptidase family protein [Dokdonella sp.]